MTESPGQLKAIAVRAGLNPANVAGPLRNLLDLVEEELEIPVITQQLGDDGIAGAHMRYRARSYILVNGSNALVRMRFTLAHELGHYSLDHGATLDKQDYLTSAADPEVEANTFAAELLLPEKAVRQWRATYHKEITLEAIVALARLFGVSAHTALYRLDRCHLLEPKAAASLDKAIQDGRHLALPMASTPIRFDPVLRETRKRTRRLPAEAELSLARALTTGLVSSRQAAHILKLPETQAKPYLRSLVAIEE